MTPDQEPHAPPPRGPGRSDLEHVAVDELFAHIAPEKEPFAGRGFAIVILVLLVLNVPWYLPDEVAGRVVRGLPVYAWTALASAVGLACATSFAALWLWRDDAEGEGETDPDRRARRERSRS